MLAFIDPVTLSLPSHAVLLYPYPSHKLTTRVANLCSHLHIDRDPERSPPEHTISLSGPPLSYSLLVLTSSHRTQHSYRDRQSHTKWGKYFGASFLTATHTSSINCTSSSGNGPAFKVSIVGCNCSNLVTPTIIASPLSPSSAEW